jgi:hypothetical protein
MDLPVHRTMLLFALKRAAARRGQDLAPAFHRLWLGNWLTDMNQATAFFDALEERRDPYARWKADGTYDQPQAVRENREPWTRLFRSLWAHEWASAVAEPAFAALPASDATPASADEIGGYDPRDHGDVVDRLDAKGDPILDEHLEFEPVPRTGMTETARGSVLSYGLERWIRPAFSTPAKARLADRFGLSMLGHATHVLQDFFAHSNFVELVLQIAAHRGNLPSDCAALIRTERSGTFVAYRAEDDPARTPVMTGRFDRIDLVASLLQIYRTGLLPPEGDLVAGGFAPGTPTARSDLLFEVMFGTFSKNTFATRALEALKALDTFHDVVSSLGDAVRRGVVRTFGWVARRLTDDAATQASMKELEDLAVIANSAGAADFARVGRLMYVEHVIEQRLRDEAGRGGPPRLPHHTLVNKDHDVAQPEARLAHKLACCFATDVTTEVLGLYFSGASADDVVPVLERVYRHPRDLMDAPVFRDRLWQAVDDLYGVRWWQHADDDAGRIAPA